MATNYTDLTIYGKSDEKKRVSIFSSPLFDFKVGDIITKATLFKLAPNCIVQDIKTVTTDVNSADTVSVYLDDTKLKDLDIATLGIDSIVQDTFHEAGGLISLHSAVALTEATKFRVVVTYLELDIGSGFRSN